MKEEQKNFQLHLSNAEVVLSGLADNSIDLIVTDPPYFKVKNEPWDRQWNTAQGFLDWLDTVLEQCARVLKPNGSLYLFASPQMGTKVETLVATRFNVLNNIRWQKPQYSTKAEMFDKATCRRFLNPSETIIFAEHYGADNIAKGEAGYGAKCDELRGFVFEPIRAYLDGERKRAGVPHRVVISDLGMAGHDSHFFSTVQWKLPLLEQYEKMREIFGRRNHGGSYLERPYEDLRREYEDLRREYEDLRREYEDLRRPFNVTADVPYTDVWTFKTVNHYPGKHPCEKPLDMLEHIISASSREGATVLDCFMGTGNTGVACAKLGRKFIGVDKTEKYFKDAERRIRAAYAGNFKVAGATRRRQEQQPADLFAGVDV